MRNIELEVSLSITRYIGTTFLTATVPNVLVELGLAKDQFNHRAYFNAKEGESELKFFKRMLDCLKNNKSEIQSGLQESINEDIERYAESKGEDELRQAIENTKFTMTFTIPNEFDLEELSNGD